MAPEATGVFYAPLLPMSDSSTDNSLIKQFVRDVLGCGCPDDVFEQIIVSEQSDLVPVANTVYEIGGRLLVMLVHPCDWQASKVSLEQLVIAGRRHRDRHGFNRFRLVVASDDTELIKQLPVMFEALTNIDEKMHLHVMHPQRLPGNVAAKSD